MKKNNKTITTPLVELAFAQNMYKATKFDESDPKPGKFRVTMLLTEEKKLEMDMEIKGELSKIKGNVAPIYKLDMSKIEESKKLIAEGKEPIFKKFEGKYIMEASKSEASKWPIRIKLDGEKTDKIVGSGSLVKTSVGFKAYEFTDSFAIDNFVALGYTHIPVLFANEVNVLSLKEYVPEKKEEESDSHPDLEPVKQNKEVKLDLSNL